MDAILVKIAEIATQQGLFAALAVYLIWKQQRQYDDVCAKLNEVEMFVRDTMVDLIRDSSTAINGNTAVLQHCKDQAHKN